MSLERLEWRNKVLKRQKNIENLKKQNERAIRDKGLQPDFSINRSYDRGVRRLSPNTVSEGRRRKEKIDLDMPTTSFSQNKIGVGSTEDSGGRITGQRAKSAGSLRMKTKQGNLFRGPTFDLVYTVPATASPLPGRENQHRRDRFEY